MIEYLDAWDGLYIHTVRTVHVQKKRNRLFCLDLDLPFAFVMYAPSLHISNIQYLSTSTVLYIE